MPVSMSTAAASTELPSRITLCVWSTQWLASCSRLVIETLTAAIVISRASGMPNPTMSLVRTLMLEIFRLLRLKKLMINLPVGIGVGGSG